MTPKPGKQRWRPAVVVSQDGNRSYAVKTEEGRIYRRNRRHLREYRPSQETEALQKSRQDCDGSLYIHKSTTKSTDRSSTSAQSERSYVSEQPEPEPPVTVHAEEQAASDMRLSVFGKRRMCRLFRCRQPEKCHVNIACTVYNCDLVTENNTSDW